MQLWFNAAETLRHRDSFATDYTAVSRTDLKNHL